MEDKKQHKVQTFIIGVHEMLSYLNEINSTVGPSDYAEEMQNLEWRFKFFVVVKLPSFETFGIKLSCIPASEV